MATRGTFRAREANPFHWIPFQTADRFSPERQGGGGATVFVPVTPEYRAALDQELSTAAAALRPEIDRYPGTPGVLILKLRERAVAKSHRPNALVIESNLQLAGMGRLDEMLVAANAASIQDFSTVIRRRTTNKSRRTYRRSKASEHGASLVAWKCPSPVCGSMEPHFSACFAILEQTQMHATSTRSVSCSGASTFRKRRSRNAGAHRFSRLTLMP